MTEHETLAWIYSLDGLRYPHADRRATPVYAGGPEHAGGSEVRFGRQADPDLQVTVAMTREDHPHPDQVSAKAGRVYAINRSVWLQNLSVSHALHVRRWPNAQVLRTLKRLHRLDDKSQTMLLGEGLWWVYTTMDAARTPGWVLIDVLRRKTPSPRHVGPHSSGRLDARSGTDPDPSTAQPSRKITLNEKQLDFLVQTFKQYFMIPPAVTPVALPATKVDSQATKYTQAIIKAARPGVTEFKNMYNSELFPFLFEGEGGLTFTEVQQVLDRAGWLY